MLPARQKGQFMSVSMRFVRTVALVGLSLPLILSEPSLAQLATRRYVDVNGANTDGRSWPNAYTSLESAIADAFNMLLDPEVTEIWVANGTYKPTFLTQAGQGRSATFRLRSGLLIRGGFAGNGAPDPDENNPSTYITILSGDIGALNDHSDNSYHVVRAASSVTNSGLLDGFTITRGEADGTSPDNKGGGIWTEGSPIIRNCIITQNRAEPVFGDGGGAYAVGAGKTPRFEKCVFSSNMAGMQGGGLFCNSNAPVLVRCTFIENNAEQAGSGLYAELTDTLKLVNCTIRDNGSSVYPQSGGAGIAIEGSISDCNQAELINCVIAGNSAPDAVGGGLMVVTACITLTNCTVADNDGKAGFGAGMYINAGTSSAFATTVQNCIFWNPDGLEMVIDTPGGPGSGGSLTVTHSDVQFGPSGISVIGGTLTYSTTTNIDADPLFRIAGDNDRIEDDSPCINRGNTSVVPSDAEDVDGDLNTSEGTPDLELQDRLRCVVDMGADEVQGDADCPADCAQFDGDVDVSDLLALLAQWDVSGLCDIDCSGVVNVTDLLALLAAWEGCGVGGGGEIPDSIEDCLELPSIELRIKCIEVLCGEGIITTGCP
jgi:hypothetical protein